MKFTEKSLFHNAKIVEDTLAKKVSIEVTSLYDKVYLNIESGAMGASLFGLSKEKVKELAANHDEKQVLEQKKGFWSNLKDAANKSPMAPFGNIITAIQRTWF